MSGLLQLTIAVILTSNTVAHRSVQFDTQAVDGKLSSSQSCWNLKNVHVSMFNITHPAARGASCACSIQPPEGATSPMSLTVQQAFDRYASRIVLSDHLWESAARMPFVVSDTKLTLHSCDLTYEQQLPIAFTFGEESGAILSCFEVSDPDAVSVDMDCHPNGIRGQSTESPQDHAHHATMSQRYLVLIIGLCLVGVVIINIIVTVSLKFTFRHQRRREKNARRRAPVYARQQTTMSHPYESILVENEEDLRTIDRALHSHAVSGVMSQNYGRNAPTSYLLMNGVSRERLNIGHVTPGATIHNISIDDLTEDESNVDLDMQVYPPSTCYEFSPNPDRHTPDTEYSYTYSSRDEMNAMLDNHNRKFSLQSIDSASGASQQMTRVKEIARFLERAFFDSGYADKTVKTSEGDEPMEGASAYTDMSAPSSEQTRESPYSNENKDSENSPTQQALSPQGNVNGYLSLF